MVQQYLRYCSLTVGNAAGNGIELADLAIQFVVHHSTNTFPDTADIRIYNLSKETQALMGSEEFTVVKLLAGYQGNYGIIFAGTIKQVRKGRDGVEGFTDIYAADGDIWHNWATVNHTIQAGYTQEQIWQTLTNAASPYHTTAPLTAQPNTNPSARGKVMYGMQRDYFRDWANTNNQLVTVDNGVITAMPLLAYKPGDTVVINANTGMISSPEQTPNGITVTCLLNPAIGWGTRLQIDNASITQNLYGGMSSEDINRQKIAGGPAPLIFAPLDNDGFYKVIAIDHIGDTRGNPWYSQIICLSIDPSKQVPGIDVRLLADAPSSNIGGA